MADAPTLGTFFKAKAKKKIKASNLNNAAATTTTDEKKKSKPTEEDGVWEEEQVVATTLKVDVAGKLMREEEKKDDEDIVAPAWGNITNKKEGSGGNAVNEKKFPSLAKSIGSSAVNIDDGSDAKVNIATSKNHFALLEGEDDDDEEDGKKRPKEIKPAMINKKKGESEKDALKREVQKYTKKGQKKGKKADEDEDEDEDEEEDEEEAPAEDVDNFEARKKKSPEKKEERKEDKKQAKKPTQAEEEDAEDLKMQVDLVASKEKYKGRKKLPPQDLPAEELEEQKENKAKTINVQPSGKKKKGFVVEEVEKKLEYADW